MSSDSETHASPSWSQVDPVALLAGVDLFADVTPDQLSRLAASCKMRTFSRGQVVWRAGDYAEELLVVVSGELEVRGPGPEGHQEVLGWIRVGECVGEMAIVLDERRSATVVTGRPARAMALHKENFAALIRDDHRLLTSLTKLVTKRAASLAKRQPGSAGPLVVGVTSDPGTPGASLVAEAITFLGGGLLGDRALLVRLTVSKHGGPLASDARAPDIVVRDRGLPPVVEATVGSGTPHEAVVPIIESVLRADGQRFGLIVVDLPPLSKSALQATDTLWHRVVRIVRNGAPAAGGSPGSLEVINRYGTDNPVLVGPNDSYVLPVEPLFRGSDTASAVLSLSNRMTPASRVLGRLTRKILGATVGIALGGGGAFGIAHIGVLSALTQEGVPIDYVAGTSMGSIIAIGYAAGLDPSGMNEIAGRIGNVRTALSAIDPSLSGTGLLNGRRLMAIFSPLIPHKFFDELEIPCRVVAMDIETGERVDIARGRLDEAFRASCSIPVIFKPVRIGDRTLVDGGMIDPVPTDVVRDMGADIAIAVNVVPQLRRGVSTAISRTFKRVNRLNPLSYLSGARNAPDIVDVFMNSLQSTEFEFGSFQVLDRGRDHQRGPQ